MRSPVPPRLLIVDDDESILQLLVAILGMDYDVTTASSAALALQHVETERFDAIITDAMMDSMDGFELTQRLRERPATATTPIIMLTALADEAHKRRAREVGVDTYVTKPFDPELLEATLAMSITTSAAESWAGLS